ncbi:MAG: glycerophosphodiester phosphodiesterase family protein [Chitinophagaceae bacterium]
MSFSVFIPFIILLLTLNGETIKTSNLQTVNLLDLQAHRGGRGLMPENTIPAIKNAIDLRVTTLEMDVVISKDNQVVVSHDPFFNDVLTTTPDGKFLTKKTSLQYLLYTLPYDTIRKYDVGTRPHPDFPKQQKMQVYKPLLSELIDAAEAYAKEKGHEIMYNIEIKSKEGFDGLRHPDPGTFSELLVSVLKQKQVVSRTTVQSFDIRPLRYLHAKHPSIVLSYLVEKAGTLQSQLDKLGFVPETYSPQLSFVTQELVKQCHEQGMKIIPWTVNTTEEMNSLIKMGVDGIISDYPNLFKQIKQKRRSA